MATTKHNSADATSQEPTNARDNRRRTFWLIQIFFIATFTALAAPPEHPHFVAGRILVRPRANLSETSLGEKLRTHGGVNRGALHRSDVRVIAVSEAKADALLTALRADPDIAYAERDFIAAAALAPNDPYVVSGTEWHIAQINAPSAWNFTVGNSNTVVAILDSGVNASQADLAGQIILPGYDFVSGDSDPVDDLGHGTAVTGTVVAIGNNGQGVAGVAYGCRVLPVKVLDSSGYGYYSTIAQGIHYAVEHGARVINLSIAGDSPSFTLQEAVNYAWSNNVVIVAAAGNNSNTNLQYPGACEHVVAVSATATGDVLAPFSSYGSYVTLSAPGDKIWTTQRDASSPYGFWSGTSFSSPVVAGVAALVASENPTLSNNQIVSILRQTADDLGGAGFDVRFGYGRVNAYRAVQLASTLPGALPPPTLPGDTNQQPSSIVLDPFPAVKGAYAGLVASTNGVLPESSGCFTLTLTASGAFSGKLNLAGGRYGFRGQFDPNGNANVSVFRKLLAPLTVALHVDLVNGTDQVTGEVEAGDWTAELEGNRNVFNAKLNPAPQAGLRTFVLERLDDSAMVATNATSVISANGKTKVKGKLEDGRRFSTSSTLSKDGDFPFYLTFNRGTEVMIGWLSFPETPAVGGTVLWVRTGTNGFAATLQAMSP